jgi:hypothetical protein
VESKGTQANSWFSDQTLVALFDIQTYSSFIESAAKHEVVAKTGSSGFRVGRSEPFRQGIEHAGQHLEPQVLLVA